LKKLFFLISSINSNSTSRFTPVKVRGSSAVGVSSYGSKSDLASSNSHSSMCFSSPTKSPLGEQSNDSNVIKVTEKKKEHNYTKEEYERVLAALKNPNPGRKEILWCLKHIEGNRMLPKPHIPSTIIPIMHSEKLSEQKKIAKLNRYIKKFEYNFTSESIHLSPANVKRLTLLDLFDTAQRVISKELPIKCMEAVCLGLYLTHNLKKIVRVPVRFRSTDRRGNTFWHIILLVRVSKTYGSIGISRHPDLGPKPLTFNTVLSLLLSYVQTYDSIGHTLNFISLGLNPTMHKVSNEVVHWTVLKLNPKKYLDSGILQQKLELALENFMEHLEKIKGAIVGTASWPKIDSLLYKNGFFRFDPS